MDLLPRSEWTDEPYGWPWRGKLDPNKVEYLFIHWPGDGVDSHAGKTLEQVAAQWRSYRNHHIKPKAEGGRGWSDIGYTHGVDLDGRLWELGGEYVAAHSATDDWGDANERGLGLILLLGKNDKVSPAMAKAIAEFEENFRTTYPRMTRRLGHRQVPGASTECPGAYAMDWLTDGTTGGAVVSARMCSPFEGRVTAEYMGYPNHAGIDIAPPVRGQTGRPVYAAFAGIVRAVVTWAGPGNRRSTWAPYRTGNGCLIQTPDGMGYGYNHMRPIVSVGQRVEMGQIIGYNDSSGNITGPHLHFEEWRDWRDPNSHRNPRISFNWFGVAPGSKPQVTAPAPAPAPAPVKENSRAKRSYAAGEVEAIQRVLKSMGYYKGVIDGDYGDWTYDAVLAYQRAQLYWPGKVADGDWGPATQRHFDWVKRLQAAMNGWKGTKIAVDGDYRLVTRNRVVNLMERNRGRAYRGIVDGIPGPVFCRMLGISTHPGL